MKKGDIVKVYSDPVEKSGVIGRAKLLKYKETSKAKQEGGEFQLWEVEFLADKSKAVVAFFVPNKDDFPPIFHPVEPPPNDGVKPDKPDPGIKPPKFDTPPLPVPEPPPLETEGSDEPKKKEVKGKTTSTKTKSK